MYDMYLVDPKCTAIRVADENIEQVVELVGDVWDTDISITYMKGELVSVSMRDFTSTLVAYPW